jgi:hypothetical protein
MDSAAGELVACYKRANENGGTIKISPPGNGGFRH